MNSVAKAAWLPAFAALSLLCTGVQADDTPTVYVDEATHLRFPAMLGGLQYVRVQQYGTSDLGYCVLYSATKDYAQICVYDLGHESLATGIAGEEFQHALKQAIDGTLSLTNAAPYQGGALFAESAPSIESEEKVARLEARIFTSTIKVPDQPDIKNQHLLLMTTGMGKFLKLNYTIKNSGSDELIARTKEVILSFIDLNSVPMQTLLVKPGQ